MVNETPKEYIIKQRHRLNSGEIDIHEYGRKLRLAKKYLTAIELEELGQKDDELGGR